MKIKKINLPSSQRFPCSKRDVTSKLNEITNLTVDFFQSKIDTYQYSKLSFEGKVILIAGFSEFSDDISPWLEIFPIKRTDFPEELKVGFSTNVMAKIQEWYKIEINSNINPRKYMFVEILNGAFKFTYKKIF